MDARVKPAHDESRTAAGEKYHPARIRALGAA